MAMTGQRSSATERTDATEQSMADAALGLLGEAHGTNGRVPVRSFDDLWWAPVTLSMAWVDLSLQLWRAQARVGLAWLEALAAATRALGEVPPE